MLVIIERFRVMLKANARRQTPDARRQTPESSSEFLKIENK